MARLGPIIGEFEWNIWDIDATSRYYIHYHVRYKRVAPCMLIMFRYINNAPLRYLLNGTHVSLICQKLCPVTHVGGN